MIPWLSERASVIVQTPSEWLNHLHRRGLPVPPGCVSICYLPMTQPLHCR